MDTVKSALEEFKSHSSSSYGGLFSAGVTTYPNPPRRTYARADLLELQLACQTVDLSPEQLDFIPRRQYGGKEDREKELVTGLGDEEVSSLPGRRAQSQRPLLRSVRLRLNV